MYLLKKNNDDSSSNYNNLHSSDNLKSIFNLKSTKY